MARDLLPEGNLVSLKARDAAIVAEINQNVPSFLEGFAAGIERENYVSAWANDMIRKKLWGVTEPEFTDDPNYHWSEDPANKFYDPAMVANAKSYEEAEAVRAQIDREYEQLNTIARSSGGIWGQMFGGITNPHVLATLPLASESVIGMMAVEAIAETGSEVLLHGMQKTRTMQETMLNVGMTAAFVGIAGGAVKMVGKMPSKDLIDRINAGELDKEIQGTGGQSIGSARVGESELLAEDDALATAAGMKGSVFAIGPMQRLSSSASKVARDVAGRLADNPFFTKGSAKWKTRGVTLESIQEAAMGRVVIATDKVHALRKPSGLSRDEFEQEIGRAMSNGDRHSNPQVQRAAEIYRKEVINPIQEAAERAGLLETDAGLSVKIRELEDDVQRILDEGGAGPGSAKILDDLKRQEAAVVTKYEKKTAQLEKRVVAAEARLQKARAPLKGTDKPRAAPKELITKWNAARREVSDLKKVVKTETAGFRKQMRTMNAQEKRLRLTRKKLEEVKARKEKGGTLYAESYFPRVYNSQKIYSNWRELENLLINTFRKDEYYKEFDELELQGMAAETIQNMVIGRNIAAGKDGKPNALRARVLSASDNELDKYLQKGATNIMLKHAQGMQPYLMWHEAFNGQSLGDMMADIRNDYTIAMTKVQDDPNIKNKPKELQRLSKQVTEDLADLQRMTDRFMHQVQNAIEPRSAVVKALQYSKLWALTAQLGGVVLSSLPDLARPIAHYGMRSFVKGAVKAFAQGFGPAGSISSIQVKRTGAALQRALNDRVQQLSDSMELESKVMQAGHRIWSKTSGFGIYTDIMESVASHAAMDYVVRAAEKVASAQPLRKADIKQLARMGLSENDLVEIYSESMRTMGAQDSVLKYMNTMQWRNPDLAKRTEAAIGSDVRRTIIRIGIGDKPRMMDETTWTWLFQFQTFAISAQNKILVAGLQNINRHTAEGFVAMMALGMGVGAAKGTLRGQDVTQWSYEQWAFEGIDRSGMIGVMREPFNLMRFILASQGITDGVPSRYAGQGIERAIMAPSLSLLGRAYTSATDLIEGDVEGAATNMLKTVPFANTWHIRDVLTQLGEK